jgi:hypothetical protein
MLSSFEKTIYNSQRSISTSVSFDRTTIMNVPGRAARPPLCILSILALQAFRLASLERGEAIQAPLREGKK